MRAWIPLLLSCSLLFAACEFDGPTGLLPTPEGSGPLVVFDLDARPLPEIPFPNDLATRPDPSSATGRRINVSLISPTALEDRVRERLDRLDGFSTFAAMSVRFDAPLDIDNLLARHGADLDFSDDAVYLIDLATGQPVALDIGYNAYPYTLERPDRYFPNDPRAAEPNLVFETVNEDLNGNGRLDPGEDTDGDGVLDAANTRVPGGDPVDDLLTFYERETDTLIVRPLVPLEQRHTYAWVLTDRLVGESGQPVRSPFQWINHADQTEVLAPLADLLPALVPGLDLSHVAFCWSFTTQTTTRDLEHLRMGLYGQGPLAWLADEFPPETKLETMYDDLNRVPEDINPFVVRASDMSGAMALMAAAMFGDNEMTEALVASYENVEFLVAGRAETPVLLHSLDDVWDLDAEAGRAHVRREDLPFILAIPKERPALGITKPFPVAIYVHGTGGNRMESLGFAGLMAKFGIATVGVELIMHGLVLDEKTAADFRLLMSGYGYGAFIDALLDNRAVDINKDGVPDEAGNFWSYDVVRVRDTIRQGALDVLRMVQILRGFDGQRRWELDADGDGRPDLRGLAGDFDGDGQVDLVGPDGPYYLFGISLGGIVSSVAAPMEPAIEAACPISSGGGLSDVAIRSLQTGVPELVVLPMMGPLIVSDSADGERVLSFYLADGRFEARVPFHHLGDLPPGGRVELLNLRSGEVGTAVVGAAGQLRVGVAADTGDPLALRVLDPTGGSVALEVISFDRTVVWQGATFEASSPLISPAEGHGVARQTPELRRFIQVSQTALDPGDPVNYAPYYLQKLPYPEYPGVGRPTHLGLVLTVGDMNVPISTGITQARAAGLIPFLPDAVDARYGATPQRVLVDNWVNEGIERLHRFAGAPWNDDRAILLDPDDLSGGLDGYAAPLLPSPLRLGFEGPDGGREQVRFLYVNPRGAHGIGPSDPGHTYNIELHGYNTIGRYFQTGATEWHDENCQGDDSCEWLP